jgi:endonuclease YncB( thermonuclease family)
MANSRVSTTILTENLTFAALDLNMVEVFLTAIVVIGFLLLTRQPDNKRKPRVNKPLAKTRRGPARSDARDNRSGWNSTPPPIPPSREIVGKCYVIDGDTIIIRKIKIRLAGIDAPELDQSFGQKSKWAMVNICKGQAITVKLNGETSYDRLVGTCYLPDGRDIGAELISQGLAVDYGFFSGGKYRNLEPNGTRCKLRRPPFD